MEMRDFNIKIICGIKTNESDGYYLTIIMHFLTALGQA